MSLTHLDGVTRYAYAAVLATLRTLPEEIGDGGAPADVTLPYATMFALGIGDGEGDLEQYDRTGWIGVQVTAVGEAAYQAKALGNACSKVLVAAYQRPVAVVTDVGTYQLGPIRAGSVRGITDRDDAVTPPVHYSISTWELHLSR